MLVVLGNHDYYPDDKGDGGPDAAVDAVHRRPREGGRGQSWGERAPARSRIGDDRGGALHQDAHCGRRSVPCSPAREAEVNDFQRIPGMSLEAFLMLHRKERRWLEEQLSERERLPTVVVTHYLPTFLLVSPRHADHPSNDLFASSLDDLVSRADVWLCGHTHAANSVRVGGCLCACNPVGHEGEESGFNPNLVFAIAADGGAEIER